MMERWWNLPLEDEDTYVPDWKPKHDVVPKPGRKEGERHPDLRASFEDTWDNFGLVDEPTRSPRMRLDELLVGFPQQQADRIRELFDEPLSPRRRGRPSSDEWRAFRIARKVVKGKAAAKAKGRRPSMKSIYGQVAKRHKLSSSMVGKHYRKYREFAEFCEGALQTPASTPLKG
jgi:hypothetical protein